MREIIIYCDESTLNGRYFSNFFGGALTFSDHISDINELLNQAKADNNLFGEIKWTKVTESYLEKYIKVIDVFFDLVAENKIKVRIMFSQNAYQAIGLTNEQISSRFHRLYYQFFKHAFGLCYCNPIIEEKQEEVYIKLLFDLLPDKKEKNDELKQFIQRLETSDEFRKAKIRIRLRDIGEVVSHDHVILQCMDIVLGSMQFRLNDLHLEKIPGSKYRGKKTKAKERLYNHILHRIRAIYPRFNIGISTGIHGDYTNRWKQPYSHWRFMPANSEHAPELTKKKK